MGEGRYTKEDGGGSIFVLLTILVLIVGIIAAAGMVMAVLNYNRESATPVHVNVAGGSSGSEGNYGDNYNSHGSYSQQRPAEHNSVYIGEHYDESVWSFQHGDNDNRLQYIDRKTRQIRGYLVDVLHEVCQIAGKNCETVNMFWQDCFFDGYPQAGILGKWVDGCLGFSISVDRLRSVKFSHELIQADRPVLLTRPGNPDGVNPDNLNGVRIGVLNGWWADRYCIFASTDYDISEDHVIGYEQDTDLNTLVAGLNSGEVHAIFIAGSFGRVTDGSLQLLREFDACLVGGDAVMMRKDSLVKSWWDPAFEKLVNSQAYRNICHDIDDPNVHGNKPGDSAADTCINL